MSEEYEVPSPHEHVLEEAGEKSSSQVECQGFEKLNQKIALMTAIIATVAALINYQSGSAQTEAMFLKNESILKQSLASNQWSYFQAKSMKSHLDGAMASLASEPQLRENFAAAQRREDAEGKDIQTEAKKLETQSRQLDEESAAKLRPHERMAISLTFLQIAIALAAITVLTRKRWLLWGSVASAGIGVVTAASAFFV